MKLELDESGLLYMRLRDGDPVDTVTLDDLVYMEVDGEGRPLGLEFIVAEDLVSFLKARGGTFSVPERIEPDLAELDGPSPLEAGLTT